MGSVNNAKLRKPGGAEALASEYDRHRPEGLGAGLASLLDPRKLLARKDKSSSARRSVSPASR